MPTYDYRCLECEFEFEVFQGINDARLTECPTCKGKVKRLIGAGAGLIFKGSGFYITDYRSKEYKQKQKSEREASQGAAKKSEAGSKSSDSKSSDSKPSKSTKPAKP